MYYKVFLVQLSLASVVIGSFQEHQGHKNSLSTSQDANNAETSNVNSDVSVPRDSVQLKLFYETLCPASINFFVDQLTPAVRKLGSHLDIKLIPYGGTRTYAILNGYSFHCHHGIEECHRNLVHACAIDVLQNITHAVLFNGCLMQNDNRNDLDYSKSIPSCGLSENVSTNTIDDILICANGTRGSELLKSYGDDTWQQGPRYVPYLLMNGANRRKARNNLVKVVCRMLEPKPLECKE